MKKPAACGLLLLFVSVICNHSYAQDAKTTLPDIDVAALPGKGLLQHDFLCTGEADSRRPVFTLYLIHKGKLVWSYDINNKDSLGVQQELGDATMRANGNIVFGRKAGATEVTPEKKIVWNYDAPKGTEIHSVEPIGADKVLMTINGVPARVLLINVKTGKIENELTLPTGKPSPHLQFRRVRMTPEGNILAAHLDSNIVEEYTTGGKLLWSVKASPPWGATRLKNGNTLLTTNKGVYISEVNKKGEVVWDIKQSDIPNIRLYQLQTAVRLKNGNTVFSNWSHNGIKDPADWPKSVQFIEVTPEKKVVWALSQWNNPDIGLASSIQILDDMNLDKIPAYRVK
jgi:hypothetical protein